MKSTCVYDLEKFEECESSIKDIIYSLRYCDEQLEIDWVFRDLHTTTKELIDLLDQGDYVKLEYVKDTKDESV